MQILAQPFQKDHKNPYTYKLYSEIQKLGTTVDHVSLHKLCTGQYQIFHRHWPERTLNDRNFLRAAIKTFLFLFLMDVARLRGMKNVWTVHNLGTHEKFYPRLEKFFWKILIPRLDGYISLSHAGKIAAQNCFPELKTKPGFVVPHGHYRGEYPDTLTREQARCRLGVSEQHRVFLLFGNLRRYKNTPTLVQLFRALPDPNYRLYVVGKPSYEVIRDEIETAASSDERIFLELDYIESEKIQIYLRAADLVVLPYQEILNSGSALLALSFDCPVLVPQKGSMSELQQDVGADWVRTYLGELTALELEKSLAWAIETQRQYPAPLHQFEGAAVAQKTIDAYRAIATSPSSTSPS